MPQGDNHCVDFVEGAPGSRLLLIADHASSRVPPGIELGIPAALLDQHIALDIGAGPLSRALAHRLGCPAVLAAWSRLVVDLNRESDEPNVISVSSDGWTVPGNQSLTPQQRDERIGRYWQPYHAFIEASIAAAEPAMLVGIHSFTPQLASRPNEKRPWQVGILYNQDDQAAQIAIRLLLKAGIATGDNEPYSGRELNATMNRHAEARGLPYLGFEVRQDLIADAAGAELWAGRLSPVITTVAATLACGGAMDQ
jgi:predicted N-formylglutamate amidohydrolase